MKELYRKHKWLYVAGFCFGIFIYYFIWSIAKPYNYGHDEYARFQIIYYLFENGKLPSGWLSEVRNPWWGFSYAFYLTWLPPILSAICMKVVSLFTLSAKAILVAARFPSVISSVLTSYFIFKIVDKLLSDERIKWFVFIFISTTPQLAHIASYINNDSVAILGSAIVCYAWVYIFKEKLNFRISVLLSVGISVIMLSYYNAYGWILLSAVLFVTMIFKKDADNAYKNNLWACGLIVTVIVLGLCGFFLVRNSILYEGDVFGLKSAQMAGEMYGVDDLKPSLRETPQTQGQSMSYMLLKTEWISDTALSCIGYFGHMLYACPVIIYIIYFILEVVGYLSFICDTILMRENLKEKIREIFFRYLIIFAAVIPVYLSMRYSYYTDFQPQGRYIYPALPAVAVMFGIGYEQIFKLLKDKLNIGEKVLKSVIIVLSVGMVIVSIYVFAFVYLPSSLGSMEMMTSTFPKFY